MSVYIESEKDLLDFFKEEESLNEDLKKGMNWIVSREGWLLSDFEAGKGSCGLHDRMIRFSTKFYVIYQQWEMHIDYDLGDKTWNLDVDVCGVIVHLEDGSIQKSLEMRGYKDFDSFLKDFQPKLMRWYRKRKKEMEDY